MRQVLGWHVGEGVDLEEDNYKSFNVVHSDLQTMIYKVQDEIEKIINSVDYANCKKTRTETGEIDVKKGYRLEADLGYLVNNTESDGESTTKENLNFHMLYQRQKEVWGTRSRCGSGEQ